MPQKFYVTYPFGGLIGMGLMWWQRDSMEPSKSLWWVGVAIATCVGVVGALSALRASMRSRLGGASDPTAFGIGFGLIAVLIARYAIGPEEGLWFGGLAMALYPVTFCAFLLASRRQLGRLDQPE